MCALEQLLSCPQNDLFFCSQSGSNCVLCGFKCYDRTRGQNSLSFHSKARAVSTARCMRT